MTAAPKTPSTGERTRTVVCKPHAVAARPERVETTPWANGGQAAADRWRHSERLNLRICQVVYVGTAGFEPATPACKAREAGGRECAIVRAWRFGIARCVRRCCSARPLMSTLDVNGSGPPGLLVAGQSKGRARWTGSGSDRSGSRTCVVCQPAWRIRKRSGSTGSRSTTCTGGQAHCQTLMPGVRVNRICPRVPSTATRGQDSAMRARPAP
jgi:hypothetical protein